MSPLQSIPAHVRTALYWVGYVFGVLGQGITIVWGAVAAASPHVSMPLWLVIASATIGLAQTQLNLLAGSNVTERQAVTTTAPEATTVTTEVDFEGQPTRAADLSAQLDALQQRVEGLASEFTRALNNAARGKGNPHRY